MKWLFMLEEDYTCDLKHFIHEDELDKLKEELSSEEVYFCAENSSGISSKLIKITRKGQIIVFKGYSWDGNSPKINFLALFWIGIPDGLIKRNKPVTYYASLIHDVLGQFKFATRMPSRFKSDRSPDLWFSRGRRGRDGLYFSMLKTEGFLWRHVYYLAVSLAGPLYDTFLAIFKKVSFESGDCP